MHKILIVEDDQIWQQHYAQGLEFELKGLDLDVTILAATTIEDAELLFEQNPDVAIIVMDACIGTVKLATVPLIEMIRKTFQGPMIAASGELTYRAQLMVAGCNIEAPKAEVVNRVAWYLQSL